MNIAIGEVTHHPMARRADQAKRSLKVGVSGFFWEDPQLISLHISRGLIGGLKRGPQVDINVGLFLVLAINNPCFRALITL